MSYLHTDRPCHQLPPAGASPSWLPLDLSAPRRRSVAAVPRALGGNALPRPALVGPGCPASARRLLVCCPAAPLRLRCVSVTPMDEDDPLGGHRTDAVGDRQDFCLRLDHRGWSAPLHQLSAPGRGPPRLLRLRTRHCLLPCDLVNVNDAWALLHKCPRTGCGPLLAPRSSLLLHK